MQKPIVLGRSSGLLSALILSLATGYSAAAPPAPTLYVSARAGLNMRVAPSPTSPRILTIPYKSQIDVLERQAHTVTIDGAKGQWVRTMWHGRTGWVFGAYLTANPGCTSLKDYARANPKTSSYSEDSHSDGGTMMLLLRKADMKKAHAVIVDCLGEFASLSYAEFEKGGFAKSNFDPEQGGGAEVRAKRQGEDVKIELSVGV